MRRIGRLVLWLVVFLIGFRGVGAILAGPSQNPTAIRGEAAGQAFPDDEARAFAVQFARAYLTFTPQHPGEHELSLRRYLASDLRDAAALEFPVSGPSQRVSMATVARTDALARDRALVTVAATVANSKVTTRYLTVPVARDQAGGLVVYDFPAFSSPPAEGSVPADALASSLDGPDAAEIEDLLTRFLTAFLDARKLDQLSYFLARDARVTPLAQRYRMREVTGLAQLESRSPVRRVVLATVRAADRGTHVAYTLRYRIQLTHRDRWYVLSIDGSAS